MRVLATGATGLIGRTLLTQLAEQGHEVVLLSRFAGGAPRQPRTSVFEWQPLSGPPPIAAFDGVNAIVNLMGEPVAGRWTRNKRRAIYESRVVGTRNLVAGLTALEQRPEVLVSGSALGFYGERGDDELAESEPPGAGFLATVCIDWETEAAKAEALGMRVVRLRTANVLGDGGMLGPLVRVFRMRLGGRMGSGRQWWPWIHVEDVAGLIVHALEGPLSGALNATSPIPVRQRDFARCLARVLRRPSLVWTPAVLLRAAVGEFAGEVLTSTRMTPRAALESGYEYCFTELEAALQDVLGPSP